MSFQIAEGFIDVTVKSGKALGILAGLGSSVNTLTALGTAAAQVAAGGLVMLPALIGAAGAAAGAAKLGMQGFGDAITNMGDPEKFAEALEKLAPAAQETALAMKAMQPAWSEMQQTVQQNLFAGMATSVSELGGTYIPILKTGLGGITTEMGNMARNAATALIKPAAVNDVNEVLAGTTGLLGNMPNALANVTSGFLGMAGVGATYLPAMGTAIENATAKFKAWVDTSVESGRFVEIIEQGKQAFQDLGAVFGNIGGVLSGVFNAMQTAGVGAMSMLIEVTGALNAMANSASGQEALVSVFTTLSTVATQVSGILQGLMPVIAPLVSIFGLLATTVGGMLLTAVQALAPPIGVLLTALRDGLAPVLPVIATAFGTVMTALGPLVGALVGALVPVMNALLPIVGQIATVVGTALAAAFNAITPVIVQLTPLFAEIARLVGDILLQAVSAIAPLLPVLADAFMQVVAAIIPLIPPVLELVSSLLPGIADAITIVVIPAIQFLVPIIVWLIGVVVNILTTILNFVSGAIKAFNDLRSNVSNILSAVGRFFSDTWNNITSFVQGAISNIGSAVGRIGELPGRIGGWLNQARGFFTDGFNGIVSFVQSVPGRIVGALGNLGNLLVGAGRALIDGFTSGIRNAVNGAISAVRGLVTNVRNLFPFSPAKTGPLSGRGYVTYSGAAMTADFAGSLRAGMPGVIASARALMDGASSEFTSAGLGPGGVSLARPAQGLSTASVLASGTTTATRPERTFGDLHVHVEQISGSPAETGRFVALALRTVG